MPILMRTTDDCEIAAIATAAGVTYEAARTAFLGINLPLGLNDPVRGNPETCYLAIAGLGKWKQNRTWSDLENQRAKSGKTVILVHNPESPNLKQHWVVLAGYYPGGLLCWWGDSETPKVVKTETMKSLFLNGTPNCAFEIVENTIWNRFKRWFNEIF